MRAAQIDILLSGVLDHSGTPLNAGKVYFYQVGTTTAKTVYTDWTKTTPASQPTTLDAYGKAQIYCDGPVKLLIKDAADSATLYTYDNLFYGQQDSEIWWGGTSTGAANTYAITVSPAIQSLKAGTRVAFKAHQSNTSAATINVNGLGAVNLLKMDGKSLVANDILLNALYEAVCISDGGALHLVSVLGDTPLTWTPTVTASGSMTIASLVTSYALYKRFGDLVWFALQCTFTTGGTASTAVYFTLPVTAPNRNVAFCGKGTTDGTNNCALMASGISTTQGECKRYDNANWTLTTNNTFIVSGCYSLV